MSPDYLLPAEFFRQLIVKFLAVNVKVKKVKFRCRAIYSTAALSAYCTLDP
jgi:hypothetical protein